MQHRRSMPVVLLALLGAVLLLSACGPSNTVRLLPPPPLDASVLPAPNAPSVSVVNFEDKRVDTASIGVRRDGSAFTTSGDVAEWISRALADELARSGFQVTFAANVNQARSGNPDYLVTGQVDEVWLKENSSMEISSQMRVKCALANRKGRLWSESTNASQSRSGLPSGSTADNLLLDTLRDLVKPMAQKIVQTIDAKKN
ncbi:MAG: hypothetical protein HDR50_09925 [Desulfovibrio sp.]|uniref:hypothetical protein n=1 Tax=Desulfovibrio sp. TaxID=885 RepID=UPI00199249D7|nr:hypothetical protein [Desulfovibrio sp.]MBD5417946.1 hypothetical protein [Desulfovibrio sp.]MBD5626002.1 hypothetical protein [Desulfovibrio sp.]